MLAGHVFFFLRFVLCHLNDTENLDKNLDTILSAGLKKILIFKALSILVLPPPCPGFSWDRVNFLSSSWYRVMFWVQHEKNVDNSQMFSVVAK